MEMEQDYLLLMRSIHQIKPDKVWEIIRTDVPEDYEIIDVRTQPEYEEAHLPGAINIPLNELEFRVREISRKKKIITYGRTGGRSMGAAILLANLGYPHINNMLGGIMRWEHQTISGPPEEKIDVFVDKKDIREVLLIAMQMERGSQTFYHLAAQRVSDEELKGDLEMLADIERGHRDELYKRLKYVWPEAPALEDIHETEFMEGRISIPETVLKIEASPPKDRMEILEFALEKECQAYEIYLYMANKLETPLARVFYDLARQERMHIDELSQLI